MPPRTFSVLFWVMLVCAWLNPAQLLGASTGSGQGKAEGPAFPVPIESYVAEEKNATLGEILRHRVEVEPFNAVATLIFFCAILHTFLSPRIQRWAHHAKEQHEERLRRHRAQDKPAAGPGKEPVSFKAEVLHFVGEIEAIFGIWVIPLIAAIALMESWHTAEEYLSHGVNYTEPIFVVVIMAVAASRPVVRLSENMLGKIASLGGGSPAAWWLTILTVGPVLGSFITEPAAMTISALLLLENFYRFNPSARLRYATLGLLFVNVSVGGTLTHFAAPPVLMVAGKWGWGLGFMMSEFGWKAVLGILVANILYFAVFRGELRRLGATNGQPDEIEIEEGHWANRRDRIPGWITAVHVLALFWTVFTAHYTALYLGGFLVFIAFTQATSHHQNPIQLRGPILVGFFLAGLVIHGTLQQWWIAPLLSSLSALPLMLGSVVLTAFNDNAAITYLASLVPGFSPEMKYAVVAGAVTGGGLTVIANAPNPAGQSILARCFPGGILPLNLFLAALVPTIIMGLAFLLLP
jgi:hypothetical protein